MMDDFFTRALIAGIGVATVTGPLGCFIVWRRMAYFGDTMAHSALLGVVFALALDTHTSIGVFMIVALVSIALLALDRVPSLPVDSILGILSHTALAAGLVLISVLEFSGINLHGLLFGDILAVSKSDILIVAGGGAAILVVLSLIWRAMLAGTVSPEIAEAENMRPEKTRIIFMLIMALVIALAMKVTGVILLTALLIIPASAARRFAGTPELMAVYSVIVGVGAVVGGLYGSLWFDTPSGPSIVLAAAVIFAVSLAITALQNRLTNNVEQQR